jgi:phage/plasmid-associated DNA primase
MDKIVKNDLKKLRDLGITYVSIKLSGKYDISGRIRKIGSNFPKYADIKLETYHNDKYNASFIPLGERYNLIGIDVDNKNNTIRKYMKMFKNNGLEDTLTMKTMNDGFHYYYKLNKKQATRLGKADLDFKSKNNMLFGINVDVKYTNQGFFGPSLVMVDNPDGIKTSYIYQIHKNIAPIILPDILFNEIVGQLNNKTNEKDKINDINTTDVKLEPVIEKYVKLEPVIENKIDTRLRYYLDCLNLSRFRDYESWLLIGAIIHNEKGSLDLFHEYSKKVENYDGLACNEKWTEYQNHERKNIGIGSLIMYARQDNPEKYKDMRSKDMDAIILKILNEGSTDEYMSDLFYLNNSDSIMYEVIEKQWYVLNVYNIWKKEHPAEIGKMVTKQLVPILENYYMRLVDKKSAKLDIEYKNYIQAKKCVQNMKTKKNIVENLIEHYKQMEIYEKLDNINDDLFAFDNGVYDLKNFEFRLPFPHEYITKTCGYRYTDLDKNAEDDINDFTTRMFVNKSELEYVLTTIAICLAGSNIREEFMLWISRGRSGKGVLLHLVRVCFGSYYDPMEMDYLNKKNGVSATNADPIMSKKKDCRIIFSTEPIASMEIRIDKIKQWSGRDVVQTRTLYGGSFNYVPKFTLFLQSNHEISFGGNDSKAIIERLRVVRFPFTFVENPELDYERKLDRNIKSRLNNPSYPITFFHILLNYYKQYIENNKIIKMPETIQEETIAYSLSHNPFVTFYRDILVKDRNSKLPSNKLLEAYKKYNGNSATHVNHQELRVFMLDKGHKIARNKDGMYYDGFKINMTKLNSI